MTIIPSRMIKDDSEYEAVVERMEQIFDANRGTAEGHELESLLGMVDAYQKKNDLMAEVEPVEVIKFVLNQQGLSLQAIASYLGGEEIAHQIMSGKRSLTPQMIQAISTHLHIPIEALI